MIIELSLTYDIKASTNLVNWSTISYVTARD